MIAAIPTSIPALRTRRVCITISKYVFMDWHNRLGHPQWKVELLHLIFGRYTTAFRMFSIGRGYIATSLCDLNWCVSVPFRGTNPRSSERLSLSFTVALCRLALQNSDVTHRYLAIIKSIPTRMYTVYILLLLCPSFTLDSFVPCFNPLLFAYCFPTHRSPNGDVATSTPSSVRSPPWPWLPILFTYPAGTTRQVQRPVCHFVPGV